MSVHSFTSVKLFLSVLVEQGLPLVTHICRRPLEEVSMNHIQKMYRTSEWQSVLNKVFSSIYFSFLIPHIYSLTSLTHLSLSSTLSHLCFADSFHLTLHPFLLPLPSDIRVQVIIYQGGQVFSLANHLNGRVGFVATMPSTSASIFINNTQLSDTGTYQCLVNNLPDRGGRNIGVIGLTVLGNLQNFFCAKLIHFGH